MNAQSEPAVRVCVDPTNPGQFFACCGLLELADRLWEGAEGWFEERTSHFLLRPQRGDSLPAVSIVEELARAELNNVMTPVQLARRDELAAIPKSRRETDPSLESEKKDLDALWREAPLVLHNPFRIRLDWFVDERAGGSVFKTWAGQQSVVDIARGMKAAIVNGSWRSAAPHDWLSLSVVGECLPFNFDSALGGMGADRDIGFSLDPLKEIRVRIRPLLELAAFVGLQRFRPARIDRNNRFQFSLWSVPLVPSVAGVASSGLLQMPGLRTFEFRLLYRTKYLKSFLPARPVERRAR